MATVTRLGRPSTWKIEGAEFVEEKTGEPEVLESLRIAVIDDDPALVGVIVGLVRSFGVSQITRAMSGNEAQILLDDPNQRVDCVICDCAMDEGNGLQLLKLIRTGSLRSVKPNACFVLITGMTDQMTVHFAGSLSANEYLRKPFTPNQLKSAIFRGLSSNLPIDIQRYSAVSLPRNWPTAASKGNN